MAKSLPIMAAVLLGGVLLAPDADAQRKGRFRLNVPKKDPAKWGSLAKPSAKPLGQIFPSPTKKKALTGGTGAGRAQEKGTGPVPHTPKLPPYLVGAPTRIVERYDENTVRGYFLTADINEDRWLSFREMWMAWGTSRGEFAVIDSDADGGVVLAELDARFRLIVDTGGAFPMPYRRGPGPPKRVFKTNPKTSDPETATAQATGRTKPPAPKSAVPKPATPKPPAPPVSKEAQAMEAGFRRYDADGDSRLSPEEVSRLLVASGLVPESGVASALEGLVAYDTDKDGAWTLEEFLSFLNF